MPSELTTDFLFEIFPSGFDTNNRFISDLLLNHGKLTP
jgi:hypothetical protein